MICFVKMIFITEVVLVEIPTNVVQILAFHTSLRSSLIGTAKWCGWIEIILYTVTSVVATSVYLYLACSQSQHACYYAWELLIFLPRDIQIRC
jgi:hypothetical protein